MLYRNEIDGLRAVAVLSIVVFHFGLSLLSGGFVGVDIFFVISGFLITRMITTQVAAGQFRFGTFYARRIRRLGPALLATLIGTLIAGWLILAPVHLVALGQSAIAAMLSVANLLFWSQVGYFDTAGLYKPLLHTWSLGVEEQFYLFWPAFLLLLARVPGHLKKVALLGAVVALSYGASIAVTPASPETAFYLTPFRIFEFALGAVVAIGGWRTRSPLLSETAAIVGAALIVLAISTFSKSTVFPGYLALIPSLGAALVIAGGSGTLLAKVLTLAPLRYVGKISYSLYLVHWPLVVFYAYERGLPSSPQETALLTLAALAIAAAMYHLIEQPFRKKQGDSFRISGRHLGWTVLGAALIVAALGVLVAKAPLQRDTPSPEMLAFVQAVQDERDARRDAIRRDTCHFSQDSRDGFAESFDDCHSTRRNRTIIVIGDSHAADIFVGLRQAYPTHDLIQMTGAGCRITARHCRDLREIGLAWMADNRDSLAAIVYSQTPMRFLNDHENPYSGVATSAVDDVFDQLEAFVPSDLPIYFIGPRIALFPDIRDKAEQLAAPQEVADYYNRQTDLSPFFEIDGLLAERARTSRVTYLSTVDVLCEPDCTIILDNNLPLIVDNAHWSPAGAAVAMEMIVNSSDALSALFTPSGQD